MMTQPWRQFALIWQNFSTCWKGELRFDSWLAYELLVSLCIVFVKIMYEDDIGVELSKFYFQE
jgi:hypothetical protein